MQTLGVIKRRREIEIGDRGRRAGLVGRRDTEGIKNEAGVIFWLFFVETFFLAPHCCVHFSPLSQPAAVCLLQLSHTTTHCSCNPTVNEQRANVNCKPMSSGVTQT